MVGVSSTNEAISEWRIGILGGEDPPSQTRAASARRTVADLARWSGRVWSLNCAELNNVVHSRWADGLARTQRVNGASL